MLQWNWQNRPTDERFDTLEAMQEQTRAQRRLSKVRDAAVEHLSVRATDDGDMVLVDTEDRQHRFTHWTFGQLCNSVRDPVTGNAMSAKEYRTLPAAIAQIPMQWRLENARRDEVKLLFTASRWQSLDTTQPEATSVRAITSPTYGRVWNDELVTALNHYVDSSTWKPVSASRLLKHGNSTALTVSDRDCYAFLVDDERPIEVPGRDGRDTLYRGFYAWNSETGSKSIGISAFLFRSACANRQIFGVKDFEQLRIRHTSGAPDRWMREAMPALTAYLNSDTSGTVRLIEAARTKEVGKTSKDVLDWLRARKFTVALAREAMLKAEEEEGNPRSLWNLVQGFTALARERGYQDERVELETKAGNLMRFAA